MGNNFSTGIDYGTFAQGKTILAVPFIDEPMTSGVVSAPKYGTLTLALTFEEALKENVVFYILGVFDEYVQCDRLGSVRLSYAPASFS